MATTGAKDVILSSEGVSDLSVCLLIYRNITSLWWRRRMQGRNCQQWWCHGDPNWRERGRNKDQGWTCLQRTRYWHVWNWLGLPMQYFCRVCRDLTPKKSQVRRKPEHVLSPIPFGDHARSCLTLAFEREYSCSAPLILLIMHISRYSPM